MRIPRTNRVWRLAASALFVASIGLGETRADNLVTVQSDTGVEVSVTTKQAQIGDDITVTVTVINEGTANGGPFDVFNGSLTIAFATQLALVTLGTINFGTCSSSAGSIGCSFLSFPANTRADLVFVIRGTESGSFDLTASFSHQDLDPVSSNNSVTCTFVITEPPGSISGLKFHDLDADGVRDDGEPGLEGWVINITGPGGTSSTTTGSDGTYQATGLEPGAYSVTETLKDGWTMSFPVEPHTPTVVSGADTPNINFGNWTTATIAGNAYMDMEGNLVEDSSDPVLPGMIITLTDAAGNETTQTTDANGNYSFGGLVPGTYTLSAASPSGDQIAFPISNPITVTSGEERDVPIGFWELSTIQGFKWHDVDEDGVKDDDEPLLPGWEITATRTQNGNSLAAMTGSDGRYSISVVPGAYSVSEASITNWTQTFPGAPGTHDIVVLSGQTTDDLNFGNKGPVTDLAVVKSAPPVVTKGQIFDFTITVSNAGETGLASVAMQDVVDTANFEIQSISGDGDCNRTGGNVTCTYGVLDVGESRTTVITVRAIGIGVEHNTVTATTASPDINPENNSREIDVLIEFADVAAQKSVSDAEIERGETTVFTIVVSNAGDAEAAGVTLTDVVPEGLTVVSATTTEGTCSVADQTVSCSFGTLGADETRTVTVTVEAAEGGSYTNTAVAATTSEEATTFNNSDDASVQVGGLALAVQFEEDICRDAPDGVEDGVTDGHVVQVKLTVSNAGPDPESYVIEGFATTSLNVPDLSGTVEGNSSNVHTFEWQTEGLAWQDVAVARTEYQFRFLLKQGEETKDEVNATIPMLPKPLVLAHGLWSSAATWDGYPGWAKKVHPNWEGRVHQVTGMMTGALPTDSYLLSTLASGTSIDENAATLGSAIDASRVNDETCQVDVVGHSMGGLITRSYVHEIMQGVPRPISHAIQLGTPNEGALCAAVAYGIVLNMKATGLLPPLPFPRNLYELTPPWVRGTFNTTRFNQKGVPFWISAGAVERGLGVGALAACFFYAPNDGLVEVSSAWGETAGIPSFAGRRVNNVDHINQSLSEALFTSFVARIVSGDPMAGDAMKGGVTDGEDDAGLIAEGALVVRQNGGSVSFAVDEGSSLATVILADTTVTAVLKDPQGNVAARSDTLSNRPALMFGFETEQPPAGGWSLELTTTADSALVGYSVLAQGLSRTVALSAEATGGEVTLTGTLGGTWDSPTALATVTSSTQSYSVPMSDAGGGQFVGTFLTRELGPHSVALSVAGASATRIARAAFDASVVGVGIEPDATVALPGGHFIGAGYPNPTNDWFQIPLELASARDLSVRVFDLMGRLVQQLPDRRYEGGEHILRVPTPELSNGTYIAVVEIDGARASRPFVVIRE